MHQSFEIRFFDFVDLYRESWKCAFRHHRGFSAAAGIRLESFEILTAHLDLFALFLQALASSVEPLPFHGSGLELLTGILGDFTGEFNKLRLTGNALTELADFAVEADEKVNGDRICMDAFRQCSSQCVFDVIESAFLEALEVQSFRKDSLTVGLFGLVVAEKGLGGIIEPFH